jgi:hypothetical protein
MATYGSFATATTTTPATIWTAPTDNPIMQGVFYAVSGDHNFTVTWADNTTDVFPVMDGRSQVVCTETIFNRIKLVQAATVAGTGSAAFGVIQIGSV